MKPSNNDDRKLRRAVTDGLFNIISNLMTQSAGGSNATNEVVLPIVL